MSDHATDTPVAAQTAAAFDHAAKKAYLLYDQLRDMRRNVRHVSSLDGIAHFIHMANRKTEQIKAVLKLDADVVETLVFLEPIDANTSQSEYPSAIIDGKRGQFMVISGVLMGALRNFMRLYLSEQDRANFAITEEFFTRPDDNPGT